MFSFTQFIQDLVNTQELIDIVDLFNWQPAISELFKSTPEGRYIIICDEGFKEEFCLWTDKVIQWYQDFTLKYVHNSECWVSKSDLREKLKIILKVLRDYSWNCVRNIRIDYSSINNMMWEETKYAIINARIFYN